MQWCLCFCCCILVRGHDIIITCFTDPLHCFWFTAFGVPCRSKVYSYYACDPHLSVGKGVVSWYLLTSRSTTTSNRKIQLQ